MRFRFIFCHVPHLCFGTKMETPKTQGETSKRTGQPDYFSKRSLNVEICKAMVISTETCAGAWLEAAIEGSVGRFVTLFSSHRTGKNEP